MNSVDDVYSNNLCCNCGTCEGVCPINAIKLALDGRGGYKPVRNVEKCTHCNICIKCCPGGHFLFNGKRRRALFFYGHSKDRGVRSGAGSGGVTTELLCHLVNTGLVDKVVVVTTRKSIMPSVSVTRDIRLIRASSSSKYCPVPLNRVISTIKKEKGFYAVVGLPCHIQGLKKYASVDPQFRHQIKVFISLFCNHTPSFRATDYLLSNLNVSNPEKIIFRGLGWPGYTRVFTKARRYRIPWTVVWNSGFGQYFKPPRCLICNDPFGGTADMSVGDAWFLSESETNLGETTIVVRSHKLLRILKDMREREIISLTPLDGQRFFACFGRIEIHRTAFISTYLRLLRLAHHKIPSEAPASNQAQAIAVLSFLKEKLYSFMGKVKTIHRVLFVMSTKGKRNIRDEF